MKPLASMAMLGAPAGTGLGADEDEYRRAVEFESTGLPELAEPQARGRAVALDGVHFDVADDIDLLVPLNPAGEVVGHALANITPAQEQRDAGGVVGEEHRRLAGRVAPTHDDSAAVLARGRSAPRCRIEMPAPSRHRTH